MVDSDSDRDKIILEMVKRAKEAAEPGTVEEGQIIAERGDLAGGAVTKVKSAGYVTIYCTRTGVPSRVNRNGLARKLQDKHTNTDFPEWVGKPAFDTEESRVPKPFRGECLCLLHKDHPDRAIMDENGLSGLQTCGAAHLASPYEVDLHMKSKHRKEWATIKDMKEKIEKDVANARQERLIDAMIATAQSGKAPVANTRAPRKKK